MSPQRRAKGEGSVSQRADGTWQYRIDVGKDTAGNRQRKYLYARTRSALLRKIADETARGGGTIRPRAKGTVGAWVERWLRDDVKPNRSANTYAQYETMWRVHAAPVVGNLALEKFDVEHVVRLYAALRRRGIGTSVLHRVGVVLSRAIEVAIRQQEYRRPNPFRAVESPKHRPKEALALDAGAARAFLAAAVGTRYEALWVLLLTAGLRLSEALGLEWRDVDLERGSVNVRQGVVEVNGFAEAGPLKTKSSRRQVAIGKLAISALRRRKGAAAKESLRSGFVFTTSTARHPLRSNLRRRHFLPILKAAGIEGLTIHGLRHSMTTLALASGVPVRTVSGRLGHSTTRLTLDRYGHLLAGADQAAAETLDGLLGGAIGRPSGSPKASPRASESTE